VEAEPHFDDLVEEIGDPTFDAVAARYEEIEGALERATGVAGRLEAVQRWDRLRRELDGWEAMVHLRFNQDTRDEGRRRRRQRCDELMPKLTRLSVGFKRKLLESRHRAELVEALGEQAFSLWESDVTAFDPAIEPALVEQSRLEADYVERLAGARIEFRGEELTLSTLRRYTTSPDRETRHAAEQARWGWFAENGATLDGLFDELVRLRTDMARQLGFGSYVELGYRLMQRVDYSAAEVARFREQVREHVVPLAAQLRQRQAARLGVRRICFWDEAVHGPEGNPVPGGGPKWMLEQAHGMFAAMHPELAGFFRVMDERGLLDLQAREGKADGGFCTGFPVYGLPYIFANFNGTKADVEVFTHESGHALQFYRSAGAPLLDYVWPTTETCEIHSMALEFLSWPHLDRFFGEQAERFRRNHLTDSLLFLPYGVTVDHFQHRVYERPEATPAERKQMWQELEQRYLPWRRYRDLGYPAEGGFWQLQRHIYIHPFYYIDYTLALTCALQLWVRARQEPEAALEDYLALCDRGGTLPFGALARSAGLVSPLDRGALAEVVGHARAALEDLAARCSREQCTP
jgi:M3 family oligoendopeptidase